MNPNIKQKRWGIARILVIFAAGIFMCLTLYTARAQTADPTTAGTGDSTEDAAVGDLNQEIDAKRKELEAIQKKADLYEENVKTKQQEASTLENQLSLIDVQVQQSENEVERVTTEIESLNLELEQVALEIAQKSEEVQTNQETLAGFLRILHRYDQRTVLEIFMTNQSFSDFFDTVRYAEDLQTNVEQALVETKNARDELQAKEDEKKEKKESLNELSSELTRTITDLGSQKEYKAVLLEDTQEDEAAYQELLEQAQREQQAAQSEIGALESKARAELEDEGVELNTTAELIWPVAPLRGISAYFHDPTYPFRYLFEHPGIDIPSPQGTAIRAADNGYVVRAKNAGLGYSYIMIVHNNEISTVYGHVSRIDVSEEQYVVRGQVIGAVGGLPGTPGAGGLTTGSHLHFEVRSGGIPVNPLDYLPGY